MTIYRKYTPTDIESLAQEIKEQLSGGILPQESLQSFKFRGPGGKTWTVIPDTGEWYCFIAGKWQPAEPPGQALDGSLEIQNLAALPLPPLEKDSLSDQQAEKAEADIREMIEQAAGRVRDSYRAGRINSAEAENLLRDLFLLDPGGVIWSYGIYSEIWYKFREGDWESAGNEGPDPQDFEIKAPDTPVVCISCGSPLQGGKFCSECGTPAPEPEPTYTQAAREVVERFTEAKIEPLPEQVVPDWEPAPGYPEVEEEVFSQPADTVLSPPQLEYQLRISEGVGAGESFPLGEQTRVGRKDTNQIVLADGKCSLFHTEVQQQEDGYVIIDQDSTNGTLVNGKRIEAPTGLKSGDIITIGDTKLVFEEGEVYPETIISKRPLSAEKKPVADLTEQSDSPPQKRRRRVFLVFTLVFIVTCLCCFSVGLGGYFLSEDRPRIDWPEIWPFSSGPAQDGTGGDSSSQPADPELTDRPQEITDAFGHTMLLVPAGAFEMGADAQVVFGEFQKLVDPEYLDIKILLPMEPVHTVTLDDYYIDKFEVTNAQYAEFLNELGNQQESGAAWLNAESDDALIFLDGGSWQPREGFDDHPVVEVSWYGARAFCQWRGARLPSEAEWEKAARGTDGRLYPWGNNYDGGNLNVCDSNCPLPFANMDHNDGYSRTASVYTYSNGVSPYGIYNLTGNVSEWTADWLDVYPGGDPDLSDDFGQIQRVKRGGSWRTTGAVGTTYRAAGDPSQPQNSTGFRCSRSP